MLEIINYNQKWIQAGNVLFLRVKNTPVIKLRKQRQNHSISPLPVYRFKEVVHISYWRINEPDKRQPGFCLCFYKLSQAAKWHLKSNGLIKILKKNKVFIHVHLVYYVLCKCHLMSVQCMCCIHWKYLFNNLIIISGVHIKDWLGLHKTAKKSYVLHK